MTLNYPQNEPFDALTGDLLPHYRDAYLHGQLSPTVAFKVEQYLGSSPVRTRMALSRYHELTAAAQVRNRSITPPQWVQQQLMFQPTVSKSGPLRRPVVQVAVGLFGALCIASAVQWVRNEPLVPAPVVAAVAQVATSASQATKQLVRRFSEAPSAPTRPERAPTTTQPQTATVRLAPTKMLRPAPAPLSIDALAARPVPLALEPTADSLAKMPTKGTPASSSAPVSAVPARVGIVRGRISDATGRPLVGATVLAKGATTHQATSTDAAGNYELTVPAGTTLQYGYAGYADHLQSASLGTTNITLQPSDPTKSHLVERRR